MSKGMSYLGYMVMNLGTSVPVSTCQIEQNRTIVPAADALLHAPGEGQVLCVWDKASAEAKDRTAEQERRVKAIEQKLDRLDEAFLFAQSIDGKSYERRRARLREELTFAQIDHHVEAVDELDLQGILTFAGRILPRASDL